MIYVIGNASIDTLFRLEHLPLPGETLVAEAGTTEDLGGKGANQAIVVARCGGHVRLVGPIGTDAAGQRIRANLAAEGVATDGLWERPVPPIAASSCRSCRREHDRQWRCRTAIWKSTQWNV